jgi:hypothetical protein
MRKLTKKCLVANVLAGHLLYGSSRLIRFAESAKSVGWEDIEQEHK